MDYAYPAWKENEDRELEHESKFVKEAATKKDFMDLDKPYEPLKGTVFKGDLMKALEEPNESRRIKAKTK